MRTRVLAWGLFGVWLLTADARQVSAQGPTSVAASYDLFYSELGERTARGAHVDVAIPAWHVVAEVGLNDFEGVLVTAIMGGVRVPLRRDRALFRPFLQVLAGQWRCCDISHALIQPGVGLELGSGRRTTFRGQFDYRRIFFDDPGENAYRVSAGLVLHLGR